MFNHRNDLHWTPPTMDQDQGEKAKKKARCIALAAVAAATGTKAVWVQETKQQGYENKL